MGWGASEQEQLGKDDEQERLAVCVGVWEGEGSFIHPPDTLDEHIV